MFSRLKKELEVIEDKDVLLSLIIAFSCFILIGIAILYCLLFG